MHIFTDSENPSASSALVDAAVAELDPLILTSDGSPHGLSRQWALPSPKQLKIQTSAPDLQARSLVDKTRASVRQILKGQDDRLLVIVGPCSIHEPRSALDYARLLARARECLGDGLELLMRVYFEKPRTTIGWKGLIQDPWLDGTGQMQDGLYLARELLVEIANLGVPTATEFLDPLAAPYLEDLISWGAVGARTTESQTHREMASGLGMPVGFKNGTDGNVRVACDAIEAASVGHCRLGLNDDGQVVALRTPGNPDGHLILRGGREPNYQAASVAQACESLVARQLAPRLIIDCSHGNSGKQHERQAIVAAELAARLAGGDRHVCGVMLESHLKAGSQPFLPGVHRPETLTFGQSITDGCMDWPSSLTVLTRMYDAILARRRLAST